MKRRILYYIGVYGINGQSSTPLKSHAKYQKPAGFKQVAAFACLASLGCSEFERSNYAISADLPERTDPKTPTATLENGVLTVVIKKQAESRPREIEIQ